MIGLGSIVNAAAIVAGGCVGLVAGKAISERVRVTLVSGMAVGTLFVGASSTFSKMLSILWREKKIRVANLLPSLVVAIVWTLVKGGL